jgi:carboxylesterase type B
MSKGLIHRAIAQSGSALNPWAFQHNPKKTYDRFVKASGCSKDTTAETVKCLKELSKDDILKAQMSLPKFSAEFDMLNMKFVPTIESPKAKGPRFLEEHPATLMKKGKIVSKVPYLTGFTENEGSFFSDIAFLMPTSLPQLEKEWDQIAPNMLYFDDIKVKSPSTEEKVAQSLKKFYFGKDEISVKNRDKFTDILSDRFFVNGIIDAANLLSKQDLPVYTYIVNYQGSHSGPQFLFPGVKERNGVAHADEILYMFNCSIGFPEMKLGTDDGEFSEKLIKLLVSFAKDGKPSATWGQQKEWKPIGKSGDLKFYDLDLKKTGLIDNVYEKSHAFWNSLPLQENEKFEPQLSTKDEL